MEEIKIDSDVPMPGRQMSGRTYGGWPWGQLKIGESFFVGVATIVRVSASRQNYERKTGFKFSCRTVTEDGVKGVRVWRTA